MLFSVLTCCIELLSWDGFSTTRHEAWDLLGILETDAVALRHASQLAPMDLVQSTFRGLRQATANQHLQAESFPRSTPQAQATRERLLAAVEELKKR